MKYLVLALALIGCAGKNPDLCQIQTPGSNVTVHSYGDSITAGAGASVFCSGYQALFTIGIGANGDDEGISGSTLEAEMPRIVALQAAPQDINTILPGFNNVSLYGSDPSQLQAFHDNLIEALTFLGTQGRFTLVGTTLYASTNMIAADIPNHTNANVDLYVNVIKEVVASLQARGMTNLILVDTNTIYNPDTMSNNNYHPDDYGHSILAQAFLQAYQGVTNVNHAL